MTGFTNTFFTISLNHNQSQQLKINDCLTLAPFWLEYDCVLFWSVSYCDSLGSGSWMNYEWIRSHLHGHLYSSDIHGKCLLLPQQRCGFQESTPSNFVSMDTPVGCAATLWFPRVYTFQFRIHGYACLTPSDNLRPRIVSQRKSFCQFIS
jgi:hypothetical protein